jgi:hypothetical protein
MVFGLWWVCKSIIFRNEYNPPEVTTGFIIKITKEFVVEPKEKKQRVPIIPELDLDIPWGFFDGSIQGDQPVCGVGKVFFLK